MELREQQTQAQAVVAKAVENFLLRTAVMAVQE
jgi:hypothetical protein